MCEGCVETKRYNFVVDLLFYYVQKMGQWEPLYKKIAKELSDFILETNNIEISSTTFCLICSDVIERCPWQTATFQTIYAECAILFFSLLKTLFAIFFILRKIISVRTTSVVGMLSPLLFETVKLRSSLMG